MSSVVSSINSYEITIPANDDIYLRQIDEYRVSVNSESESGSGSDGEHKKMTFPEAIQRLEKYLDSNELEVLRHYVQCKKQIFEYASTTEQFKYNALYIHCLVASIALAFLPWFSNTHIAISVLGGFIVGIQQWIHHSKCNAFAQVYANNSQAYSTLLVHFDKGQYMSSKTLLKNLETKLECIDCAVPYNYVKLLPSINTINIFSIFKHIENSRNIQIRKYIRAENNIARNKNVDSQIHKITKIKDNLSKLNYNKLLKELKVITLP